jgi:hypothetical protein
VRSRRTAPSLAVLLGDTTAPDACRLLTALEVEGEVIAIEPATLGSLEVRTHGSRADARLGGVTLQPDAVLVWRLPQTCEHPRRADLLADPVARSYHVRQWTTMLRGLLLAWEVAGVPIVNGADVGRWDEKTAQIVLAASVGFRTPDTLQSAHPDGIRASLDSWGGAGVTKAFVPFHSVDARTARARRQLTREVSTASIDERYEAAVPTPALYQPIIPAAVELRVVVVGDRSFAARIDREQLGHVDSRHAEPSAVPACEHDVPLALAQRCRALLDRCGLDMAVIDLLIDGEGEAVFLDLNPTGVFDWIACRFDLPIYPAVAELLAQLAAGTIRGASYR